MRPEPPLYDVELVPQGSTLRIVLRGDIDLVARAELEQVILGLDPTELKRVLVDIRQVTFFDSTGLNMASRLDRWGREHGIAVLFTRAVSDVMRALRASGLALTLTFTDAPEDQLSSPD
jgi:anti-sigma B factor antagonist